MERPAGLGESAAEVVWWAAWWKGDGVPCVPATDVANAAYVAACVPCVAACVLLLG
jgi:hypothetical protein